MTASVDGIDPKRILDEIIDELTGVLGFTELIQEESARRRDFGMEIRQCVGRMALLLRALGDRLRGTQAGRFDAVDAVLESLEPELRRFMRMAIRSMVESSDGAEPVRFERSDSERLPRPWMTFARERRSASRRIAVGSTRSVRPVGSRIVRIESEGDAGLSRPGDGRGRRFSESPGEWIDFPIPFSARARDADASFRIGSEPVGERTAAFVGFPPERVRRPETDGSEGPSPGRVRWLC